MSNATLRKRIEPQLRHRVDDCLCDVCIGMLIDERDLTAVTHAVVAMATAGRGADFSRYRGKCTECGRMGLVTGANRMNWA